MVKNRVGVSARAHQLLPVFLAVLVFASACGGEENDLSEVRPFPPSLTERLHAIRDRASELRGLPINDDAVEGIMSQETYVQYVQESVAALDEDDRRELEAFDITLRLIHLIGPDDELLDIVTRGYTGDILGLYVPDENRLLLIGQHTTIDQVDELTLAHEYVHSFQYGSFDMDRLEKLVEDEEEGSPTDYATTIRCLQEGDASLGGLLYAEEVSGPEWSSTYEPPAEEEPEETIPPAIQRYFGFDYGACVLFAFSLHEADGWEAIDAAYEDPPWTTEQILHPEKYLSREGATDLAPLDLSEQLGAGWERLDVSQFGEFDVYNYLLTLIDDDWTAADAAEGWGSGWIAVYAAGRENDTEPEDVLAHISLEWDTPADLVEFVGAFGGVVEVVSDGRWELVGPDGPARWRGDGEYGYVTWDEDQARADIVISTDEGALKAATGGLSSG